MPIMNEINLKVNVSYGDSSLHDQNSAEANLVIFILWGIVLPLIATVGLVGNILTIIVLWRKEMHSTTILYLRGMVITDTGILIGSVITLTPISCANYLHGDALNYFRDSIYPVIHTPGYYIIMTLQQCNVWITVSVSMERYIAICHPFRAARLITRRKTIIVMVVIVIVSLMYNIPHLFATRAAPCGTAANPLPTPGQPEVTVIRNDGTVYDVFLSSSPAPSYTATTTTSHTPAASSSDCLEVSTTSFGFTTFYLTYRSIMYSIIIYVIPFLALLILNSFLIKELMTMQRRRSGTNIHEENEANLSLVLVLIVIVFIFCQTPGLISQFDMIPPYIFFYWLAASNLLFTTNSAVNFLIYTAFGRKFRRVLLRVFRHIFSKTRRQSQSSYRMTQYTVTDYMPNANATTHCVPVCAMSCYNADSGGTSENNAEQLPLNSTNKTSKTSVNGVIRNVNGNGIMSKRSLSPMPEMDFEAEDVQNCEENMETLPLTSGTKDNVTYYSKDSAEVQTNSDKPTIHANDEKTIALSDCDHGESDLPVDDPEYESEHNVVWPNPDAPSVFSNSTGRDSYHQNANGKVTKPGSSP